MSIAKTYSTQLVGLRSEVVTIEVDISNGLHSFSIVGLGDRSVEEARDRISAAIKNSGFTSPKQKNQKVVISLAPADLRKEGPSFDMSMALSYLCAAGDVVFDPAGKLFLGELSLEGNVRRIHGLLPILCQAEAQGFTEAFVPKENEPEASLSKGITVFPVSSMSEIVEHLRGTRKILPIIPRDIHKLPSTCSNHIDMGSIRGNETAKRGLEIAAAGSHNVMMFGPPGTGKTMLAQGFPSILPPLPYDQAIEVTSIHSAARELGGTLIVEPPFRSPHHTASYPSIVGGGSFPRPGEISLAHRGVLFLDEFPEFDRSVIEALRQPLEDHTITISRARGTVTFPAQCMLLASMNPCPCGKGKEHGCTCSPLKYENYRRKLSGPILDRFDIWLNVDKVDYDKLAQAQSSAESSLDVRKRVDTVHKLQKARFERQGSKKSFNSEMNATDIETMVVIEEEARQLLLSYSKKLELSGRAFHRVIKVSQTIADLNGSSEVNQNCILEALQYRQKPL